MISNLHHLHPNLSDNLEMLPSNKFYQDSGATSMSGSSISHLPRYRKLHLKLTKFKVSETMIMENIFTYLTAIIKTYLLQLLDELEHVPDVEPLHELLQYLLL